MENQLISKRSRHSLTKYLAGAMMVAALMRKRAGGWLHDPGRGVEMLITMTFYVRKWTVTIQVRCRNRHSAK